MDVSAVAGASQALNVQTQAAVSSLNRVIDVVETATDTLFEGLESVITGLGKHIDVSV